MSIRYTVFLLAILIAVSACNTATPTPRPALPNPIPTEPPAPAEEAVKPLQGQLPLPVDAPTIAYGEIKEGELAEPGAVDEWVFNANVGERVSIMLNSGFDSYLELLNSSGELVASNDDSGNNLSAALLDVQLAQTGPHVIRVRGYDGQTGSYALALTGGHPTVGGGLLGDQESRNVMLSEQGFKWRYTGQQGSYLSVKVQGEAGVDSFLSIYGPDGTLLASDDDSGQQLNPELIDFELPADGTYVIRAHTINSTGLVTLTLSAEAQVSGGGPLVAGKAQPATLKPGRSHRWEFEGQGGQVINISMVSPEFDTFLELRDANEVILAENDDGPDGTNSVINNVALPADGRYTVVARSLTDDAGGDYEITLKLVKVTAGGGPLATDKPAQASLVPGQTDTWTFDAAADTFITVKVESAQADTYLELYDPGGNLLTEDDDSGGNLNAAILDFPIAEDGQYQAVVRASRPETDQGGVYEISLLVAEDLATSGQLESGQTVERDLTAGEQHTWTFSAPEDTFVTVRMESDTLDTYLSLYNSEGELLYVNDDFFAKQAAITNFIVPATGDYRIVGRAYSPEEEGSYRMSLEITQEALPLSAGNEAAEPAESSPE
ncbi:MAG: hypothetical protein Kow0031_00860 [Anaerolineae bacterium]